MIRTIANIEVQKNYNEDIDAEVFDICIVNQNGKTIPIMECGTPQEAEYIISQMKIKVEINNISEQSFTDF